MKNNYTTIKNYLDNFFLKLSNVIKIKGFYDKRFKSAFNFIESKEVDGCPYFDYDFNMDAMHRYHKNDSSLMSKLVEYLHNTLLNSLNLNGKKFVLNVTFDKYNYNSQIYVG